MVVTPTHVMYINRGNKEKWEWPFEILTNYGYDGNVFFLEAGQKCSSKEGLCTYTFMSEEAKELFDVVAKNSLSRKHQEALQPPNESPTDTPPPSFA